jgi:hypothetical protein
MAFEEEGGNLDEVGGTLRRCNNHDRSSITSFLYETTASIIYKYTKRYMHGYEREKSNGISLNVRSEEKESEI